MRKTLKHSGYNVEDIVKRMLRLQKEINRILDVQNARHDHRTRRKLSKISLGEIVVRGKKVKIPSEL